MVMPAQGQETRGGLEQITYENYTGTRLNESSLYVLIYFTLSQGSLTLDWDSCVHRNAEA